MFTPVPSEDQPHGIMDFVFISEAVFSQRLSPLGFPTYEKVDGVDTSWKTPALSFICLWYIFLILMCNLNISGLHQIFFVCFCDECTSRFVCFFQSLFFQQLRVNIIKRPLSLLHFLLIKYIQSTNGSLDGFNSLREQLGRECNIYCHSRSHIFGRLRYIVHVDGDLT